MFRKLLLAIATTIILWASAFVGIKHALTDYTPIHLAALRYLTASCVLVLIALVKGIKIPEKKDITKITFVGVMGIGIYNIALNYGETTVSAGAASFIVNTVPIITTVLSIFLLKERFSLASWMGVFTSFIGVGLISIGESQGMKINSGIFFVLLAAICQALYFVVQKPLLAKYRSFDIVCYSIWTGTLLMLPFSAGLIQNIANSQLSSTVTVVYLGIFPAAIANLIWSFVISKISPARSSVFLYLVPITALLIGYVWLGEMPSVIAIVGGLIVLSGIIVFNKFKYVAPKAND